MSKSYTKQDILAELTKILTSELEIEKDKISLDADLFNDLDLDSIDAVDIAVRMQKYTTVKLTLEEFKKIRTVNDVVECVYALLQK